jgi:hypothetical protein
VVSLAAALALQSPGSYGPSKSKDIKKNIKGRPANGQNAEGNAMRRLLLIVGLLALAMGLLWIGQGTGVIDWPKTSFMINQLQWAGYGAALAALGLILIWQARR